MDGPVGLQIRRLRKSYSDGRSSVEVLRGLDLRVEPGEMFVLLGPNGGGKSTLLGLIAGLLEPDGGSIRFSGEAVTDVEAGVFVPPERRNVAMVFQNFALYPHLTVAHNIAFPLRHLRERPPRREMWRRVEEAAELLDIGHLLDRMPRTLSEGQRQRVAVARAIVRRPRLLLMDEPLSNLDEKLRSEARHRLRRVQRATGVTVLYVTHQQAEAMTMGDRIGVLHRGVIEQTGSPQELYEEPATIFIASFMGADSANLLAVEVSVDDGSTLLRAEGAVLRLPPEVGVRVRRLGMERLVMGIRAEHVAVGRPGAGTVDATVELVQNLGSECLLHVVLPNRRRLVARGRMDDRLIMEGRRCSLTFDLQGLYFFDPRGARLP